MDGGAVALPAAGGLVDGLHVQRSRPWRRVLSRHRNDRWRRLSTASRIFGSFAQKLSPQPCIVFLINLFRRLAPFCILNDVQGGVKRYFVGAQDLWLTPRLHGRVVGQKAVKTNTT